MFACVTFMYYYKHLIIFQRMMIIHGISLESFYIIMVGLFSCISYKYANRYTSIEVNWVRNLSDHSCATHQVKKLPRSKNGQTDELSITQKLHTVFFHRIFNDHLRRKLCAIKDLNGRDDYCLSSIFKWPWNCTFTSKELPAGFYLSLVYIVLHDLGYVFPVK